MIHPYPRFLKFAGNGAIKIQLWSGVSVSFPLAVLAACGDLIDSIAA